MNAYKVTAVFINLHAGTLGLSASQADKRIHRLTPLGDGRYELTDPPVGFKRGEVFGFEGDLPKGMGQDVEAQGHYSTDFLPPPKAKKPKP